MIKQKKQPIDLCIFIYIYPVCENKLYTCSEKSMNKFFNMKIRENQL